MKIFSYLTVAALTLSIVQAVSTSVSAASACSTETLDRIPSAETREISADSIGWRIAFNIPVNSRAIAHSDSESIGIVDPEVYRWLECNGELDIGALEVGSIILSFREVNTLNEGDWYCGISAGFCNEYTDIVESSQGQLSDGRGWGLVRIRQGFDESLFYVGALSTQEGGSFVVSMPPTEQLWPVFQMVITSVHHPYQN